MVSCGHFSHICFQYSVQRSFIRELYSLIPTVDEEFKRQVTFLPFDEACWNHIRVKITPERGFYKHASFVFEVVHIFVQSKVLDSNTT